MSTHNAVKKFLNEERIYGEVFPFVKLYQGFWLGAVVLFGMMFLLPVFYWDSYVALFEARGSGRAGMIASLGVTLLMLIGYSAMGIWISVSICRMSKWIGYGLLLYCAPALCFSAIAMLFALLLVIRYPPNEARAFTLRFAAAMWAFCVPFSYACFLGCKAGRQFVFADDDVRRVVAEIDPHARPSWRWISTALCVPVPLGYVREKGVLSVTLFVLSGVSLASFGVFAPFSLGFGMAPILFSGEFEAVFVTTTGDDVTRAMLFLMKYSPFIFGGLAVGSLGVGLATRAGARKRVIRSIHESHKYDVRPPIIFLRSFQNDQVSVAAPRLPFLGRMVNLFQAKRSLDVILLEEGTAYGPVAAVGRPDEPAPPYGAARGYFMDGEWRSAVSELTEQSRCIVVALDYTDGVLWEVEHVAVSGLLTKTLFLIPPRFKDHESNRELVRTVVARIQAVSSTHLDFTELSSSDTPVIGFCFDDRGGVVPRVSNAFSEASYLLVVRWFLRVVLNGAADSHASAARDARLVANAAEADVLQASLHGPRGRRKSQVERGTQPDVF